MPKCDFNKTAKPLYSNHNSAQVFFCKYAAFFRTPFHKNTSERLLPFHAAANPLKQLY